MLHGAQRGLFEVEFCLPSQCADRLEAGAADIGIVPSAELLRLDLDVIVGAGIASEGIVRSILLITKAPLPAIRTLAADTSSRTTVQLARLYLARKHGAMPRLIPQPPDLDAMLGAADACIVIGDPALRLDVMRLPYQVIDLGAEWTAWTGLPMVFAVWAARKGCITPGLAEAFLASCRFGLEHLDDIVRAEARPRGLSEEFAREYLTRRVRLELGDREYQGLDLFLSYLRELGQEGAHPC